MACPGSCCLGLVPFGGARSPGFAPPCWGPVPDAVLHRALAPDPVACVVVEEGLLDLRAFFDLCVRFGRSGAGGGREDDEDAPSGWGGSGSGREDDADAWSGWGCGGGRREDDEDALSGLVGRVWGGAGGGSFFALLSFLACWGLGAGVPLFLRAHLGGTGRGGAWGAWGWKKGCVAYWPGSRSGGSTDVCMVAFARLRVRSASLRTVSEGSFGHGSAAGLSSKGWWRW